MQTPAEEAGACVEIELTACVLDETKRIVLNTRTQHNNRKHILEAARAFHSHDDVVQTYRDSVRDAMLLRISMFGSDPTFQAIAAELATMLNIDVEEATRLLWPISNCIYEAAANVQSTGHLAEILGMKHRRASAKAGALLLELRHTIQLYGIFLPSQFYSVELFSIVFVFNIQFLK